MKTIIILFLYFTSLHVMGQQTLSELLSRYNKHDIPYISSIELAQSKNETLILDAREFEEYQVSHIKNALFVGYTAFDLQNIIKKLPNKHQKIAVYCSLGVRSEIIANQLKIAGYTNVFNLYGGIFEWKNNNFSVVNQNNTETDSIHAYSKKWGKWLKNGKKVY